MHLLDVHLLLHTLTLCDEDGHDDGQEGKCIEAAFVMIHCIFV